MGSPSELTFEEWCGDSAKVRSLELGNLVFVGYDKKAQNFQVLFSEKCLIKQIV